MAEIIQLGTSSEAHEMHEMHETHDAKGGLEISFKDSAKGFLRYDFLMGSYWSSGCGAPTSR